jgi:AcrR family transcriptional regulator
MVPQRPDRRVRRTRHRLKEALLELIEEREYEAISIREISDRADVGRSTFYSHFASKEDLLFSGFDSWLLSLPQTAPTPEAAAPERPNSMGFRFSRPLLRHIRSQKRFFQATFARGCNPRIRRKVTALLVELIQLEMGRIGPARGPAAGGTAEAVSEGFTPQLDAKRLRDARAHAVVGAFLELVSWWLNEADRLSVEAVDGVFQGMFAD